MGCLDMNAGALDRMYVSSGASWCHMPYHAHLDLYINRDHPSGWRCQEALPPCLVQLSHTYPAHSGKRPRM